jgi:hypothetical protein
VPEKGSKGSKGRQPPDSGGGLVIPWLSPGSQQLEDGTGKEDLYQTVKGPKD